MNPAPLIRLLIQKGLDLQAQVDASFENDQLSLPRAGCLVHLAAGPLPLSALAERLHCGRSNVTSMVDRLERAGWVRREADPSDRRVIMATITESGRIALDGALADLEVQERALVALLGPDGAADLERLLKSL